MTRPTFQGSIVALVTPFRNGKVDEAKLRELVDIHVAQGTDGIVPCGTTGESPTLSHDEHKRVVEVVIDAARGRLPIIAGTGSNATSEAIDLTAHAKKAGATAALVVNPYYNRPTQEGLYRHFRAVAEAVDIPIIVYNIAGRTAVNVETDTMARLVRDCPSIVRRQGGLGVPRSDDPGHPRVRARTSPCSPGDDNITLPLMSVGGRGVISVIANVVPRGAEMTHAALRR
jgi:4-hydroxy-tetrahydrodipicolinate synthase